MQISSKYPSIYSASHFLRLVTKGALLSGEILPVSVRQALMHRNDTPFFFLRNFNNKCSTFKNYILSQTSLFLFYKLLEIRVLTIYSVSSLKMEQPIDKIVTCSTVHSRLQVHKTTNRIISSIKWKIINGMEH